MQRKKPFSGKKKKEQLRKRRERKAGSGERGEGEEKRKDEHHDEDPESGEEESGEEDDEKQEEEASSPKKASNVLTPDNITIPKEKFPRNKLVTVFEKESKEEVEARRKKGYLPLDMYHRNHVRSSSN